MRWWIVPTVASLAACHAPQPEPPPPAIVVDAVRVTSKDLVLTVQAAGALEAVPGRDVNLAPATAGRLSALNVSVGDPVQAGQPLATMDPGPLQDAARKAQAALEEARAEVRNEALRLRREAELVDAGVSARQDEDDARARLAAAEAKRTTAQAEADIARRDLLSTRIEAPFAGVVVRVGAAPGEWVDPSKPVVEVADVRRLELRISVPAPALAALRPGQASSVRVAGQLSPLPAQVVAVAPSVDPATGAGVARIRLENPGTLRMGQVADATIVIAEHHQVPAVPARAINRLAATLGAQAPPGDRAVTVIAPDGKTHVTPVRTGAESDGWVELLEGPKVGTPIVANGGFALPEGSKVTVDAGVPAPEAR